jgi:hypothetical protein
MRTARLGDIDYLWTGTVDYWDRATKAIVDAPWMTMKPDEAEVQPGRDLTRIIPAFNLLHTLAFEVVYLLAIRFVAPIGAQVTNFRFRRDVASQFLYRVIRWRRCTGAMVRLVFDAMAENS